MNTRRSPVIDSLLAGCGGLLAFLGVLTASSVVADLHPTIPIALAVATALVGAMQAGLNEYVQRRTVPAEDVLEARVQGDVIAGPANERVTTGEVVRQIDSEPLSHTFRPEPGLDPMPPSMEQ